MVPPKHPKMIIFSRKPMGLSGKPTILGFTPTEQMIFNRCLPGGPGVRKELKPGSGHLDWWPFRPFESTAATQSTRKKPEIPWNCYELSWNKRPGGRSFLSWSINWLKSLEGKYGVYLYQKNLGPWKWRSTKVCPKVGSWTIFQGRNWQLEFLQPGHRLNLGTLNRFPTDRLVRYCWWVQKSGYCNQLGCVNETLVNNYGKLPTSSGAGFLLSTALQLVFLRLSSFWWSIISSTQALWVILAYRFRTIDWGSRHKKRSPRNIFTYIIRRRTPIFCRCVGCQVGNVATST